MDIKETLFYIINTKGNILLQCNTYKEALSKIEKRVKPLDFSDEYSIVDVNGNLIDEDEIDYGDVVIKRALIEMEKFKAEMLKKTPAEIYTCAYEIAIKQEYLCMLECSLNDEKNEQLAFYNAPLSALFDEWMSVDASVHEPLQVALDFCCDFAFESSNDEKFEGGSSK